MLYDEHINNVVSQLNCRECILLLLMETGWIISDFFGSECFTAIHPSVAEIGWTKDMTGRMICSSKKVVSKIFAENILIQDLNHIFHSEDIRVWVLSDYGKTLAAVLTKKMEQKMEEIANELGGEKPVNPTQNIVDQYAHDHRN